MPSTCSAWWAAAGVVLVAGLIYLVARRSSGGRQGLKVGPTAGSDPAWFFAADARGCTPPGGCLAPMITDPPPSCGPPGTGCMCRGWDPAASAETSALATSGGIGHPTYGERRLQRAVEAAFDERGGLSDAELQMVMHSGAP